MTVLATHVGRTVEPGGKACGRCGRGLKDPRPAPHYCLDCTRVEPRPFPISLEEIRAALAKPAPRERREVA